MRKLKKNLSKIFAAVLSAALIAQPAISAFASIAEGNQMAEEVELEDGDSGDIALTSLLPLEERDAYVYMNDYTSEELEAVPLQTVLDRLVDYDGNPIEIPEDATIVWVCNPDEEGDIIYDDHMILDRDDTVDLNYDYDETIQMIVGSGKQLDADNVIYNIDVRLGDIYEYFDFSFYEVNSQKKLEKDEIQLRGSGNFYKEDIPITQVRYSSPDHKAGNRYYLNFELNTRGRDPFPNIQLEVYPLHRFLDFYRDGKELTGAITDALVDTNELTDCYSGTFSAVNTMENYKNADNLFCFVYKNTDTDTIIRAMGIELLVVEEATSISGMLYAYENGEMVEVSSKDYSSSNKRLYIYMDINSDGTGILDYMSYSYSFSFQIDKDHLRDDEYYTILKMNETPIKIVEGYYRSMEQAEKANAKDITDEILGKGSIPHGYLKNLYDSHGRITVFFEDRTFHNFYLYSYGGKSNITYTQAPVVRSIDPYFQVNGTRAGENDEYYPTFEVENSYDETLDTYYGYGYQTLFIKDQDIDLKKLKPTFYKPDEVKVHSGTEQISGKSVQDFSNGSVYYQVHIGDNLKNYNVTFKKLAKGPKLFVNGPEKREIFLDNYFDNRHDILVANIGDEALTGLKVELIGAKNVGIDEYWNLGGEDNDTLAPFESISRSSMSNLAKIRLVASSSNADEDGEVKGEIKGKLKISADGQAPVYIELTGYAGNPEIITASLSNAVKYVPYSHMVATDNMHDWNKVTFSLAGGELPEGLKLYPATGEIYGVPLETGEFPITVKAAYSRSEFEPSYKDLVLTVKENTAENVYLASDKGYEVKAYIGTKLGDYDFYLNNAKTQTFVSHGKYGEFIDFWFNGKKLIAGVDYEKESGSTRITIKSQTFRTYAVSGANTIAAEFRVNGDKTKDLKRTAQNFRMDLSGYDHDDRDDRDDSYDSSSYDSNSTKKTGISGPVSNWQMYEYNDNSWIRDNVGWWIKNSDGTWLANTWAMLPYRGSKEWYYFGKDGYMKTGWYQDIDGRWYYLHPLSDGTMGRMYYGWHQIDGKWYYFNEISDGTKGSLKTNMWIGSYYVDENGVWTE